MDAYVDESRIKFERQVLFFKEIERQFDLMAPVRGAACLGPIEVGVGVQQC
jgi:hypothetical protein